MVNRENLQRVRDHIAGLSDDRFNMMCPSVRGNPNGCGCIKAWAEFVMGSTICLETDRVADWLGLSHEDASDLFMMSVGSDLMGCRTDIPGGMKMLATREQALRVIDYAIETNGRVDWAVAAQ